MIFPLAMFLSISGAPAPSMNLSSLLTELVSRDSLAEWPENPYTMRQASSYDRLRTGPDKPNWFANDDAGHYIREETHDGRKERVMMEADGPGAIVRIFTTNGGSDNNRLRIFLDGSSEPTLYWPKSDLLSGEFGVGAPLVQRHPAPLGHGGAVWYLPIPYQHHCKMTIEDKDPKNPSRLYYHVDYRTFAPSAKVETFSLAALTQSKELIGIVSKDLVSPRTAKGPVAMQALEPGRKHEVFLPSGPHAVTQLRLSIGSDLEPAVREQVLRSVIIQADFDGEPNAIWCPVGDFAGSGAGGRELKSWYRDVDGKGNSVCRWTMPYQRSAKFTIENLGTIPVSIGVEIQTSPWQWDDHSLYFHCNWHSQTKISSDPPRDWNFFSVQGRGVLVGDVMSVFNPIPSWYGEGNEKIYVDGEYFPSTLGTGTEDYYNASWAPNPLFQTPFANHVRMDDPLSQGQNVYTRARNLDAIPFEKSLKFDFEIITWNPSEVDYAATTYWYGAPGSKSVIGPQPDEAKKPVPALKPPMVLRGALEVEELPVVSKSPGLVTLIQDNRVFAGMWSNDKHLLVRGRRPGDFVEIAIPANGKKPRCLTLYATSANDYATLKFWVNGRKVESTFNGYAEKPTPLNAIPLGVFTPVNGKLVLRAEVAGCDSRCVGVKYLAGLDAVVVE